MAGSAQPMDHSFFAKSSRYITYCIEVSEISAVAFTQDQEKVARPDISRLGDLRYIFKEDRAPNIGQIFWEIAKSKFNGSDNFPEESKDTKNL